MIAGRDKSGVGQRGQALLADAMGRATAGSYLSPLLLGTLCFLFLLAASFATGFANSRVDLVDAGTAAALSISACFLITLANAETGHARRALLLVALAAAALVSAVGELGVPVEAPSDVPDAEDLLKLLCWIAMGPAIAFYAAAARPPGRVRFGLAAGFVVQSVSNFAELLDGRPFQASAVPDALFGDLADASQFVFVGIYLAALAEQLRSTRRRRALLPPAGGLRGVAAALSLARHPLMNGDYLLWKLRHPRQDYGGFYVRKTLRSVARGKLHYSLGSRFSRPDAAAAAARATLAELRDLGLRPDHLCVEYGCGSLRLAEPLMRYLEPGRYVGMDITDAFFRSGLRRIAPSLLEHARPELLLITPETMQRVASRRPDFVVCALVLHHVPPFELGRFFANLTRLVGRQTFCAVEARLAPRPTQIRKAVWLHDLDEIQRSLRPMGFEAEVLGRAGGSDRRWWLRVSKFP